MASDNSLLCQCNRYICFKPISSDVIIQINMIMCLMYVLLFVCCRNWCSVGVRRAQQVLCGRALCSTGALCLCPNWCSVGVSRAQQLLNVCAPTGALWVCVVLNPNYSNSAKESLHAQLNRWASSPVCPLEEEEGRSNNNSSHSNGSSSHSNQSQQHQHQHQQHQHQHQLHQHQHVVHEVHVRRANSKWSAVVPLLMGLAVISAGVFVKMTNPTSFFGTAL